MLNSELMRYKVLLKCVLAELDELCYEGLGETELSNKDSTMLNAIFNVLKECENQGGDTEFSLKEELLTECDCRSNSFLLNDKLVSNVNNDNAIEIFKDNEMRSGVNINEGWYIGKVTRQSGNFYIYPFRIKLPRFKGKIRIKDNL